MKKCKKDTTNAQLAERGSQNATDAVMSGCRTRKKSRCSAQTTNVAAPIGTGREKNQKSKPNKPRPLSLPQAEQWSMTSLTAFLFFGGIVESAET